MGEDKSQIFAKCPFVSITNITTACVLSQFKMSLNAFTLYSYGKGDLILKMFWNIAVSIKQYAAAISRLPVAPFFNELLYCILFISFCFIKMIGVMWCRKENGPRQANLVLIAYASSEGSGEPAHPRSLARTSAARSYKQ